MVVRHEIGHLPFEAEIGEHLKYGRENRITVLCDNVLLSTTIPQGQVVEQDADDGLEIVQKYTFDFFNYAGIHRSVHLYTTPITYIKELFVNSDVNEDGKGRVGFKVKLNDNTTDTNGVKIYIYDKENNLVTTQIADENMEGEALIDNVKLWWPYLMHPEPGYLYTIEVRLTTKLQEEADVYRMKFGIRTLKWNNTTFLINNKPIYFRGFGRHEDSDVSKFTTHYLLDVELILYSILIDPW